MDGTDQITADKAEAREGTVRHISYVAHELVILVLGLWNHVVALIWWVKVLTMVVRCDSAVASAQAGIGHRRHRKCRMCEIDGSIVIARKATA